MHKSITIRWDYSSDGDWIAKCLEDGLKKIGINVKITGDDLDDNFGVRIEILD